MNLNLNNTKEKNRNILTNMGKKAIKILEKSKLTIKIRK